MKHIFLCAFLYAGVLSHGQGIAVVPFTHTVLQGDMYAAESIAIEHDAEMVIEKGANLFGEKDLEVRGALESSCASILLSGSMYISGSCETRGYIGTKALLEIQSGGVFSMDWATIRTVDFTNAGSLVGDGKIYIEGVSKQFGSCVGSSSYMPIAVYDITPARAGYVFDEPATGVQLYTNTRRDIFIAPDPLTYINHCDLIILSLSPMKLFAMYSNGGVILEWSNAEKVEMSTTGIGDAWSIVPHTNAKSGRVLVPFASNGYIWFRATDISSKTLTRMVSVTGKHSVQYINQRGQVLQSIEHAPNGMYYLRDERGNTIKTINIR